IKCAFQPILDIIPPQVHGSLMPNCNSNDFIQMIYVSNDTIRVSDPISPSKRDFSKYSMATNRISKIGTTQPIIGARFCTSGWGTLCIWKTNLLYSNSLLIPVYIKSIITKTTVVVLSISLNLKSTLIGVL